MKKKLLIYGAGSFARQMRFYFDSDSDYEVVHFVVDDCYYSADRFDGLAVLRFEEIVESCPPQDYDMFVAIGYKNMGLRSSMFQRAISGGYFLASYISSSAVIASNAKIGKNNVFFPQVVIEPFAEIKDNNIFWSNTTICHDVKIGSHCFFAVNSIIGGESEVGDTCFIGFNSVVREMLKIGSNTFLAAASYINKNSDGSAMYMGVPAKKHLT